MKHRPSALTGVRQVSKADLLAIGRALGLRCSERERTSALCKRVLAAAVCLRRDFDLATARPNALITERERCAKACDALMAEYCAQTGGTSKHIASYAAGIEAAAGTIRRLDRP